MNGARSSNTSLETGSNKQRRPRSPPSMYVAYESNVAKAPKPLIKLDKTKKRDKGKDSDSTASPRPSSSGTGSNSVPRRPSFLSLRRKKSSNSSLNSHFPPPLEIPPPLPSPSLTRSGTTPSSAASSPYELPRLPRSSLPLQETHVHPGDDLSLNEDLTIEDHIPARRSDKAARMLGEPIQRYPKYNIPDVSYFVSPSDDEFPSPTRGADAKLPSFSTSNAFYTPEGGWYANDDVPDDRGDRISPIAFRPPSLAVFPPNPKDRGGDSDIDEGVDMTADDKVPSPRAIRPPRVDSHIHHAYGHLRVESQASSSTIAMGGAARPDTLYMDQFLAPNSVPSSSNSIPARRNRDSKVIRAERGWEGEWNQGDMSDVINKLRTLR
ncbi:hypothetical protein MIND_00885500 [Mycena indigotica]|uniref:Uncharacterized protein n=1 Tax=Mycena indigotica TaxID=2126181 RepID=A0A8H6SIB5_9AGAR|nr:uncharacterized protein MIND_00885500 [Mycena indigotica]KAF7299362.1 hypothetical protein MIND_00885500 [Mycena indigotica]